MRTRGNDMKFNSKGVERHPILDLRSPCQNSLTIVMETRFFEHRFESF